jgi:hypothetical protein
VHPDGSLRGMECVRSGVDGFEMVIIRSFAMMSPI